MSEINEKTGEDYLLLKWGTVKGWHFSDTESEAWCLLKKFLNNSSSSRMLDKPDEPRKKLLCDVIDKMDGEIECDWSGKFMTKDEAKNYIMGYQIVPKISESVPNGDDK